MEKLEDILTRFGNKIANAAEQDKAEQGTRPRLLPDRHPVRDFFIADILDWALKDDCHSMEHPIFSLSKTPDRKVRHYEHNGIHVTVAPSAYGRATIWDKDILLYCVSVLTEGLNQAREVSRTVRLTAYDFLVTTNRHTGGRDYDLLAAALNRLKGTVINTDIETNGKRQRAGFGLIDNWQIIERSYTSGRMSAVEITLNEWLFNAVVAREILTLNRDYFRLDGGLERRLYELARKHCGRQAKWIVSVDLLHKKSGSQATLKKFRELLKRAAGKDALPDYCIRYDQETDRALFHTKDGAALARHLAAIGTSGAESGGNSGL
jgi:plasmid replication initiation protein